MYQQTNHKKLKQFGGICSIQSSISFITSSLLKNNKENYSYERDKY